MEIPEGDFKTNVFGSNVTRVADQIRLDGLIVEDKAVSGKPQEMAFINLGGKYRRGR